MAQYPYHTGTSYIEMAQTLISGPPPELPEKNPKGEVFSPELREFLHHCLKKDPRERAPLHHLMKSSWLKMHGADSPKAASQNVRQWISSLQVPRSTDGKKLSSFYLVIFF